MRSLEVTTAHERSSPLLYSHLPAGNTIVVDFICRAQIVGSVTEVTPRFGIFAAGSRPATPVEPHPLDIAGALHGDSQCNTERPLTCRASDESV